mgnify:CR=1 FL=1
MGCSGSDLGVITEDEINPPIPNALNNDREKTGKFPEGEIYYLRGVEAIQNGAADPGNDILYYDQYNIRLTISFKFYNPKVRSAFFGSKVVFYKSHQTDDKQMLYCASTEKFTKECEDNVFKKEFEIEYCFQKIHVF